MALLRVSDIHDWGEPDFTEDELRTEWRLPEVELSRDVWLVHDDGGALTAYATTFGRDSHRRVDGWGIVHPEHRGRGLGTFLMEVQARVGKVHVDLAPPRARVLSQVWVIGPDRGARELAERFGYREVRHFWQMIREIAPGQEAAWLPGEVLIRGFDRGRDDRGVHAAMSESFAEHWGHVPMAFDDWAELLLNREGFDPTLWFLAVDGRGDGEEIAGALLGSIDDGEGWVHTLGVRGPWRRRGIAGALLRHAFAEFARWGLGTVKLVVDSGNETGATRLYERAGMRVNRRYDVWEKELRAEGGTEPGPEETAHQMHVASELGA